MMLWTWRYSNDEEDNKIEMGNSSIRASISLCSYEYEWMFSIANKVFANDRTTTN